MVAGKKVNTVEAIWTRSKNEITDEEYTEFYKFVGNAIDEPMYRLHFSVDAPLALNALLFVPQENFETMGMGRLEPGVNLYCHKVLIDQHSENILPEWLRFIKGVVDSEDIPLNISRQSLQDNALVMKLRRVITKRFLKYLGEEAKKDAEKYQKFWKVFGIFLKEGVTSDFEFQAELAKLLRFESSASEAGSMIALDEYVDRMKEGQDKIYYINGPNRAAIENGPYVEMFTKQNIEILYTLEPIDDFVLSHLGEYDGKKLVSADRSDLTLPENAVEEDASKEEENKDALASEVQQSLCKWMKEILADKVKDVKPSSRLVASPAMIVNVDGMMTSSMERIMLAQGAPEEQLAMGGKKDMEINPASPLIKKLADLRVNNEEFARDIVAQIFDNAMIQAGLLVDPQQMVNRNYRILEQMAGDK